MRRQAPVLTLALLSLLGRPEASGAEARLVYRGSALSAHEVEGLARAALRAPRDSSALRELLGTLVSRLEDQGYLDARATAAWDSSAPQRLGIEVSEGPRQRIARVVLRAPSAGDSVTLARALGLGPGAWASPRRVGERVAQALSGVVGQGYAYALLGVSAWEQDSAGVGLTLSGGLGPRVTITEVRFPGLAVTQRRVVEKAMGRLVGVPYNPSAAEEARGRLAQLGLFRSVAWEGLEGEGDWSRGHLVYRVEEPRYNRFEGAVGSQGDAGVVGLANLELGNLLGTGRATRLGWESRGHGVTLFSARYAEPLFLGAPLRLEGALEQQVEDTLYVRTRWGGRARYALGGQDRVEAGYEEERVVAAHAEVEEAQLQSTIFALERDARDRPAAPRRGSRVRVEASQTFKAEHLRPPGRRTARASAVELQSEWHHPLAGTAGLAVEVHAAGRFSSQRVLPRFERYALGGAQSLRGFDEGQFRVDRYALSRAEWRWFLGASAARAFLFWDHAWSAAREMSPAGGDRLEVSSRDGLGFGLRLEAAGGLVGLDYGLAAGRPPVEGKIHLQLVTTF